MFLRGRSNHSPTQDPSWPGPNLPIMSTNVLIMGAAGRDFHNFNLAFRDRPEYRVVAFTATQIPNIDERRYPPELAGELYPEGVAIHPEEELTRLIQELQVDEVVFSYSDVPHSYVMNKASQVMAAGADFRLLGPKRTYLKSSKPVVAVCAVRTGVGKSQTTRRVAEILRAQGRKTVVVRHPMPYGDLAKQAVQRFATVDDLFTHECTIEEWEEYQPHIEAGSVVYAGVDYEAILKQAEQEADVILWDGGNNDLPFYRPDLHITLVDPHRPGHETRYFPGATNLRAAHAVLINKVDTASEEQLRQVRANIAALNPGATVIEGASPITVDDPEAIRGKRVLVVEDGPTLTHGEMPYGAGTLAARSHHAAELIDPRPHAIGSLRSVFEKYTHIGPLLPAMGYGEVQCEELLQVIRACEPDLVVVGTPIDLTRVIDFKIPSVRVRYSLEERPSGSLEELLAALPV